MGLLTTGRVSLWLDYDGFSLDASHEEQDEDDDEKAGPGQAESREQGCKQVAARDAARRLEDAEQVVAAAGRAGLQLHTSDRGEAGIAELIEATDYRSALALARPRAERAKD